MTLKQLNDLEETQLLYELKKCCGSEKWARDLAGRFPFDSQEQLFESSENAWHKCAEPDYKQAFDHHPRIGDSAKLSEKFVDTASWAEAEQAGVKDKSNEVLEALAECNRLYEEKFGYIFIINASGKSAAEILGTLRWRLLNEPADEIIIAAEEQNNITKIRLEKLLS